MVTVQGFCHIGHCFMAFSGVSVYCMFGTEIIVCYFLKEHFFTSLFHFVFASSEGSKETEYIMYWLLGTNKKAWWGSGN